MIVALTLLTLCAGPAPDDTEFLSAHVVAVMPRLHGPASGLALAAALRAPAPADFAGALGPTELPELEVSGFGFGGSSDAGDLLALQAGYIVGRMTALGAAGDVAGVRQLARWLEARLGTLAFLSESLGESLAAFAAGALAGEVKVDLVDQLLGAAEAGIAAGPERGHGYFASGLWAGLALLGGATDGGRRTLAATGANLVAYLEEDATAEGSDVGVARHIRAILAELGGGRPDLQNVVAAGRALLALRPDSE